MVLHHCGHTLLQFQCLICFEIAAAPAGGTGNGSGGDAATDEGVTGLVLVRAICHFPISFFLHIKTIKWPHRTPSRHDTEQDHKCSLFGVVCRRDCDFAVAHSMRSLWQVMDRDAAAQEVRACMSSLSTMWQLDGFTLLVHIHCCGLDSAHSWCTCADHKLCLRGVCGMVVKDAVARSCAVPASLPLFCGLHVAGAWMWRRDTAARLWSSGGCSACRRDAAARLWSLCACCVETLPLACGCRGLVYE